jgi:hypothetical protein
MAEVVQTDVHRRPAQEISQIVGGGIGSVITMSIAYHVADILSPLPPASTSPSLSMLRSAHTDRSTKHNLTEDLASLR